MPIIIAIIVLVAAVAVGTFFFGEKDREQVVSPGGSSAPETPSEMQVVATYADGTYASAGTYVSPAGSELVDVSLTIENDTVVAATFKGHAENPGSVMNQKKFADGYTAAVVGKKIDDISLTVVNGSSLTPAGFMEAVGKIKTQARI